MRTKLILCFCNSRILGEDLASKINLRSPVALAAVRFKWFCFCLLLLLLFVGV